MAETNPTPSKLSRLRAFFFQPSTLSLTTVITIGMVLGLLFWGGFNMGMEATNSIAFCTSCHEMRDTVFQEYKETIHYKNRSGVRAGCPDCHVPKEWTHKFIRKVQASQELYVKFITGEVSTPEKFEAKRMKLATHVWETMKASDSHECRNCHSWDAMDPKKQHARGRKEMEQAQKEGKTCIDCHKGIAHLLPSEYNPDDDPDAKLKTSAADDAAKKDDSGAKKDEPAAKKDDSAAKKSDPAPAAKK